MEFTEDLLLYVWKSRMLFTRKLQTLDGEPISIVKPGSANNLSGPDFEDVLLDIGLIHWSGSVEMHLHSSDWYKHGHQNDTAYENVILHVVYKHDKPVFRKDGTEIPVLELKNLIPQSLINSYQDLINAKAWIPCASALPNIDPFFIDAWLNRVLVERLEAKTDEVLALVKEQKGSWDDAFYLTLSRSFGFKTNALPFECLARSLPQTLLARHKNQALQIEALLFGQSGLLEQEFKEEYPISLKKEYHFLQKKYALKPMDASIWKFMRLRPANFPTIRLGQFAALVVKSHHLFASVLEITDLNVLRNLFANLPVHPYWETHFRFNKTSEMHTIQPGSLSLDNLLINSVAVFLFAYGRYHKQEIYQLRAIQLLEQIPPEKNQIINQFKQLGIKIQSASGSQSLLQLKRTYCDNKKCLSCGIGTKILMPTLHQL